MTLTSRLAALALGLMAAPAAAQEGFDWSGVMHSIAMGEAMKEAAREGATAEAAKPARARPTPRRAPAPSASTSTDTSYTPSLERRRANIQNFVANMRARDPAAAEQFGQLTQSPDIIATITPDLTKLGLSPTNVADAYAVWWVVSWNAAHGVKDDPSPATMKIVSRQVAATLGGLPAFAAAGDAERQVMAEGLLLQGTVIDATARGVTDPAGVKELQRLVRAGAREAGMDLDAMRLTPQGFVPV